MSETNRARKMNKPYFVLWEVGGVCKIQH